MHKIKVYQDDHEAMIELTLCKYLNIQYSKEVKSLIMQIYYAKDIAFSHKLTLPFITKRADDIVINLLTNLDLYISL